MRAVSEKDKLFINDVIYNLSVKKEEIILKIVKINSMIPQISPNISINLIVLFCVKTFSDNSILNIKVYFIYKFDLH